MGLVGNLIARLTLDKTQYSSGLKTADKEAKGFSTTGSKAFGVFKMAALAAFAAVSAAVVKSVLDASEYEKTLANISTMVTSNMIPAMAEFNDALLEQSKLLGEDTESLGKGLYDILSAGITDTADALQVLETSSIAARAGLTDTGVAADALTTIINAYGMEAGQAMTVSDLLFKTVQRGKTTFNQLAPAIGTVATIAAQAGVKVEEMGAALAIMTRNGISTDESVTALRAVIMGFLKPSEELAAAFGENAIQSRGFTEVMNELAQMPPEVIAKFFPNVRGMLGVITAAKDMTSETQEFIDTLQNGSPTMEAFEKQTETFDFKWQQLTKTIKVAGIEAGQQVLPGLTVATEALTEAVDGSSESVKEFGSGVGEVLRVGGILIKSINQLSAEAENSGEKFDAFAFTLSKMPAWMQALVGVSKGFLDNISKNAEALDKQNNKHIDAADAAKAQREEMNFLITRYESLRDNLDGLTKEEMAEMISTGKKIKEMQKGLIQYTDGYTGSLMLNTKAIQRQNKALLETEFQEVTKQMKKAREGTSAFLKLQNRGIAIQKELRLLQKGGIDQDASVVESQRKAWNDRIKASQEGLAAFEEIDTKTIESAKEVAEEQAKLREEFRREQLSTREREIEDVERMKKEYIDAGVKRVEAERWAQEQIKEIYKKYPTTAEEEHQKALEKIGELNDEIVDSERAKFEKIAYENRTTTDTQLTAAEKLAAANEVAAKKAKEAWLKAYAKIKDVVNMTVGVISGTVGAYFDMQEAAIDANVEDEKEAEMEKAKLARKQFNFNKIATVVQIGISTVEAVMKALAMLGPIAGPIAGGIITGLGVAQAGFVIAQQPPPLPSYNRGGEVGGMAGVDKNLAYVSKGEYIVNSRDAQRNMDTLENINSGGSGVSVSMAPTTIMIMTSDERIIGRADLEYIKEQSRLGGIIIHPRAVKAIV